METTCSQCLWIVICGNHYICCRKDINENVNPAAKACSGFTEETDAENQEYMAPYDYIDPKKGTTAFAVARLRIKKFLRWLLFCLSHV